MKRESKAILCLLIIAALTILLATGCSSEPCENCGRTPTKIYKHSSGEKYAYCNNCSSECDLCGDDADRHYSVYAGIRFVCEDCYQQLEEYGWVD